MKRTIFCLFILLIQGFISAQTVTTITAGSPDDAIAIDSQGNVMISGFISGVVYKYDTNGVMTEYINNLNNPNGLFFDSLDRLYVNQWNGNIISRFSAEGVLDGQTAIMGNPSGMLKAYDNDDMVFTKYSGNEINRLTPNWDTSPISTNNALLNGPVGLAYDTDGNLYVGNYNNRKIYKVLSNGDLEYIATVGNASVLGFITYKHGLLWGTVLGEHKIYTINPNAVNEVAVFAGSAVGNNDGNLSEATFNGPNGIRFNDAGDVLYISEFNSKNLRVISNINLSIPTFNNALNTISLHPNPSKDALHISVEEPISDVRLQIYNALGQLIMQEEISKLTPSRARSVNTSSLKSGSYILKLKSQNGFSTKTFLIF